MTRLMIYHYRCNICGKMMKTDEAAMNHAIHYHGGNYDCEYNENGFDNRGTVLQARPVNFREEYSNHYIYHQYLGHFRGFYKRTCEENKNA